LARRTGLAEAIHIIMMDSRSRKRRLSGLAGAADIIMMDLALK
jgi:hypothetical protein